MPNIKRFNDNKFCRIIMREEGATKIIIVVLSPPTDMMICDYWPNPCRSRYETLIFVFLPFFYLIFPTFQRYLKKKTISSTVTLNLLGVMPEGKEGNNFLELELK